MEQFDVSELDNNEKIEGITKICGICGDPHFYRNCKYVILNSRINNKEMPSRARLSLPDNLQIKKLADETYSVFTKSLVEVGTEFGPFVAKKNLTLNPCTTFPIKIFIENESDLSEYYLDTTNESECCWMMFIKPASDVEEQNLICFQEEDIFFSSIRDINAGEELKVWYSPYYAFKMQKDTLSFKESSKLKIESEININETEELNTIIKEQQHIVPRVVWNCKFCYKLEKNVTDFARHLLSHYTLQKRKVCLNCPKRFRFMQDYRTHMKLCTGDPADKNDKSPKQHLQTLTSKSDQQSKKIKNLPTEPKTNTVGGPLLLQFPSDSMDNSNCLVKQSEQVENLFDVDNYDNQNVLLDSDNLMLNVDVIGTGRDLGDDFGGGGNREEVRADEEYLCDICLKKFMTVKSIYLHLKMHMGSYYCATCKKVFSRPENLKHHKCNLVYSYKCPLCDRLFSQKKYLTKHTTVVHNKKFTCSACGRLYHSPLDLKTHVCDKVSPGEKKREYSCKICSKKFSIEKYLNRHLKRQHNEKCSPTLKYICSECSVTFSSQDNYLRHVESLHNKPNHHDCRICDRQFSRKDTLKSHMVNVHMLGPTQVNKCVQCNKVFNSKGMLYWHVKVTHNNSNYTCGRCGSIFRYSRNLLRHTKKVHGGDDFDFDLQPEEVHECPTCGIKVKLKKSLQRHIRKKHPVEYKKICVEMTAKKDQQKKAFSSRKQCPVCEEMVNTEFLLDRHVMKCHPKDYKAFSKKMSGGAAKDKQKKVILDTTKLFEDDFDKYTDTDQKCMDLRKTIENMDFSIDDTSNENLLRGSDFIDKFLRESSEQISISFADSPKTTTIGSFGDVGNVAASTTAADKISNNADKICNKEVYLSMPDLCEMDQDIKLSKNAYISENGNIVEPLQGNNSADVVLYVLK